ncbi:MAG: hypothetical protein WCJ09_15470 [Planctomycetota bacterium]
MPWNWRTIIGFWALILLMATAKSAEAVPGCPFCAPSDPPFSHRLAACDVALLVKWVSLESKIETQTESTTFEVIDVFRSTKRKFKPTDKVTWEFGRNGEPGDPFLLLGVEDQDGINWEKPVSVGGEYILKYIQKVPPIDAPDRLAFFLKFLEFPDTDICNDAYAEFSRAEFKDVAALAGRLPREKLRKWLSSTDPQSQVRLGLYGMMLGLGGDDSDAAFLESLIMKVPDPNQPRLGIDGMMAGYLLLTGERGLQKLMDAKFNDPKSDDDLVPIINALSFLWEYGQDRVPAPAIRMAMRRFLDRPRIASSVVENLSRWQDWESLDRLIASYGMPPFDSSLSKQKVIIFALVCEKDGKKTSPEKLPQSAIAARKFLDGLDPEVVKSAEISWKRGGR